MQRTACSRLAATLLFIHTEHSYMQTLQQRRKKTTTVGNVEAIIYSLKPNLKIANSPTQML